MDIYETIIKKRNMIIRLDSNTLTEIFMNLDRCVIDRKVQKDKKQFDSIIKMYQSIYGLTKVRA